MSEAKRLNEEELKYLKTQEPIGGDLQDLWGHIAWQEGEIARLEQHVKRLEAELKTWHSRAEISAEIVKTENTLETKNAS